MIYIYRLCLTLFESNTNEIHSMFLFTLCSELPAIQEIAKIDGSKNWKRKEKNGTRQQTISLTQLNATYEGSMTQWHFLKEQIILRHFSTQVILHVSPLLALSNFKGPILTKLLSTPL